MNKDNSVNASCLKHAYVEEVVLHKPVVDFVPVRKTYPTVFSGEAYVPAS